MGEAFIDPTVKVFVVSGGQPQHVASKSLRRVADALGLLPSTGTITASLDGPSPWAIKALAETRSIRAGI